jgi:hypothetical protein
MPTRLLYVLVISTSFLLSVHVYEVKIIRRHLCNHIAFVAAVLQELVQWLDPERAPDREARIARQASRGCDPALDELAVCAPPKDKTATV